MHANQDVGTSDDSGRASERLNGASVDTSHDRLSDVSMPPPTPSSRPPSPVLSSCPQSETAPEQAGKSPRVAPRNQ
ncbi:hypothetical protein KUF71_023998 [Frankliniella fusca]|uniref:Uncharacterized protein n=1 Tax=Frankliniella fusca TaxID=407009 RepID=A0AAE1HZ97_9NEOP|nr:hypothetical protein KUF71_023998 [Frankliniella fusca]